MALSLRRRGRRATNPDGSMGLMEHLFELRNRLTVAVLAIAAGGVVGFIWWATAPFGLPTLGDLMTGPYCDLPSALRVDGGPGGCQLLQTGPFEPFNIRLKVGLAVGAVLAAPVWFYQIWAFITPGLHRNERRFALSFVGVASVLFAAGALLAYWIVPTALSFLQGLGAGEFFLALSGNQYIGFVLLMLFIFGVSFELPLVVVMLNLAGVVTFRQLQSWQRGVIFGLFVFAAVATPGQDPFSMLTLAAALVVLFELAVVVTYLHDRRAAKRRAELGWDELSPDEASQLRHEVEPVGDSGGRDSRGHDEAT